YCLPLCYESLCRQTSSDFDWLIIDDGSTDNTKELVESWMADNKINITYFYKENGGMHTGHNAAYKLIDTELNVCIDSDDFMPDDAIEKILKLWRRDGSNQYAGLIGLDVFSTNGNVVGVKFPDDLRVSTYSELKPKYGVWGDKKVVYRTDIVKKQVPYPVFPDERFVPLYMPLLAEQSHPFLCYNEIFCIVDYQETGSTINIYSQYFRNPKGFSHSRKIEMTYRPFLKTRFRSAIHYVATSLISKNWNFVSESPKKLMTMLAIPFGVALYIYLNLRKNKKRDISKYVKPVAPAEA
ncbi:MAG TPA: glycosyltransferase family A protein, partial [Flavobacterium sp.]|nr:glycosyltransferase family A protein [Flavobacterium sp.]